MREARSKNAGLFLGVWLFFVLLVTVWGWSGAFPDGASPARYLGLNLADLYLIAPSMLARSQMPVTLLALTSVALAGILILSLAYRRVAR